jgi:hypothetical protein
MRLCRGDGVLDEGDRVRGEAALECVSADDLFVGCDVDAVDLVGSDEGGDPLDFWVHAAKGAAGARGDGEELLGGELAGAGNVAFDEEFRHVLTSV